MARWFTLFALCLAALAGVPAAAQVPGQDVPGTEGVGLDQNLGQKLPLDLAFTDETGKAVRLGDYFGQKGHPVLLTLVYYDCPMLCHVLLDGLTESLRNVPAMPGKDFTLVTVSFNPDNTAQQAQAQKAKNVTDMQRGDEVGQGWHFLTGSQQNILALADAAGFRYRWDDETKQFAHPATLIFVAPDGTITRYLPGVRFDPTDVRLALREASQGTVGSIYDAFLMLCFQYSPHEARYTLSVMKTLRLAGGSTVALLVLLVVVLARRHASRSPLSSV
ncbi:MAG: SCO family protein [Rhodothermales bacterium]|nr:SCO family protein [Rhodothermales bacterium]